MNNMILRVIFALFLATTISIVTFASTPSYNTEADCRNCHGNTVDRHHLLLANGTHQCEDCHVMKYDTQNKTYYPEVIRNCLTCHPTQNHIDCIKCHSPADVNISLFGRHANMNTSDGIGNVTNNDCWTCHYQKDMNRSNVYLCESCHSNSSGIVSVTDPSLIMGEFSHGMTTCKGCHASTTYHVNGTVGPLGLVEKILRKLQI
jgi:hypothetical protein